MPCFVARDQALPLCETREGKSFVLIGCKVLGGPCDHALAEEVVDDDCGQELILVGILREPGDVVFEAAVERLRAANICSMTSKGSPHGHFQRAIECGSVLAALSAARQLETLSLPDALALTVLLAGKDPERFARAAVRWHGRYALEIPGVRLSESQLVLSALAGLTGPAAQAGAETLARIAKDRRLHGFESALRLLPDYGRSGDSA
jgi:hypothetical protein